MKEHLDKVKFAVTKALTRMVIKAIDDARLQIEAQAMRFVGAKLPPIKEETPGIAERFMQNLYAYFDELTTLTVKDTEIEPDDYDNLSLIDHDYLEAMIAMEGMVKQLREVEIKGARSFLTRLETMFPNIRIDETNNPLDPEQVGDCFNEAIRPLELKAHYLLTIYREFNKSVFHNYSDVIDEANEVLVDLGVLPNLDITARERELRKVKRAEARVQLEAEIRAKEAEEKAKQAARGRKPAPAAANPETAPLSPAAEQSNAEMFSMMQTLVKSLAEKQGSSQTLPLSGNSHVGNIMADQHDLQEQQAKLMKMLTDIQSTVIKNRDVGGAAEAPAFDAKAITQSISDSLHAETSSGKLRAIDTKSTDVINLVSLLYEAIWKDQSLSVVIKALIGRTQISIMKAALSDTTFFDNENHPGRALLNELALAGIAWTESDDPENDPIYAKIKELVERVLNETDIDNKFLQNLVNELREFKGKQTGTDASVERRIRESDDYSKNLDDIHAYVSQKVNERVLKGYLDPSIRNLLDTHLHDFLVKLLVKEGPNGSSWKPFMSTIDVLLWTVQAEKQQGDRERFERINLRLLDNLAKALEIGGASKTKITKIMRQLKQVQEYTFHKAQLVTDSQAERDDSDALSIDFINRQRKEPSPLSRDDPHLRQVDKLAVGTWLEFKGVSGKPLRCTLASKIDSIDKLFFANSNGEKVVELTRMRLARELKAGSVKIVSAGSLVDRAMESVINNLKDSAREDDTSAQDIATA
ncbi:MAG: DUF1631 family protein [Proteobacteria bacterium]|nr:DUF1631 family protein [Pseudomonadota bacterium]